MGLNSSCALNTPLRALGVNLGSAACAEPFPERARLWEKGRKGRKKTRKIRNSGPHLPGSLCSASVSVSCCWGQGWGPRSCCCHSWTPRRRGWSSAKNRQREQEFLKTRVETGKPRCFFPRCAFCILLKHQLPMLTPGWCVPTLGYGPKKKVFSICQLLKLVGAVFFNLYSLYKPFLMALEVIFC